MKNKALAISTAVITLISIALILISVMGGNPFVNAEKNIENLNQQLQSVEENIKVKESSVEDLDKEIAGIDSALAGEAGELGSVDTAIASFKNAMINPIDINYMGEAYKNFNTKADKGVEIKSIVYATGTPNFGKSSLAAAETFKGRFIENEINDKAIQLNKNVLDTIAILEYGKNSDLGMVKNLIAAKYFVNGEFNADLLKEFDDTKNEIANKINFLAKVENRFNNNGYSQSLMGSLGEPGNSTSDDFKLFMEKLNNLSLLYYDTLERSAQGTSTFDVIEKNYDSEGKTVTLKALTDQSGHIYLMEETPQGGKSTITYYDENNNPWYYVNFKDNNVMDLNLTPSKVVNQKAKELLDKFATIATPSTEGLPSTEEIPSTEETSEDTQSSSTDSDNN